MNSRTPRTTLHSLLFVSIWMAFASAHAAENRSLQERFEKKMGEYEAADKAIPPPKHAVLLIGDSQFYRWKTLNEDLPQYTFINRGIDSFQISDLIHYSKRLVAPYDPRIILMHVGGNDVHNGKSTEQILKDFETLVSQLHVMYPTVPIVFSSITPGPGRWDEAQRRIDVNRAIEAFIGQQPDLKFIDLWHPMLDARGKPREDLWVEDRVHPNHAGYRLRAELTKPYLGAPERDEDR